jgi:hypothetical protein
MSNNKQSSVDKDFVPYTEALELKELGFDEPCLATIDQTEFVHINGTEYPIRGAMYYRTIDLPTFSQAFRWFREKYKIEPEILSDMMGYVCSIVDRNKPLKTRLTPSNLFQTYEEAELACLRKLIEIAQGGNK